MNGALVGYRVIPRCVVGCTVFIRAMGLNPDGEGSPGAEPRMPKGAMGRDPGCLSELFLGCFISERRGGNFLNSNTLPQIGFTDALPMPQMIILGPRGSKVSFSAF